MSKISIKNDDLQLWKEFTDRMEKNSKLKHNKISETGKKIIKLVKENIKNQSSNRLESNETSKSDADFVMKKGATLGIDRLSDKKLSQGKYKIDYRLDLHGATLEEAYNKLRWLFEKAYLEKYRCLLIITGKGLHSKDKTIKVSLEEWFREPCFANKIIKYVDANSIHGGSGAVYVLLKNK